MFDQLLTIFGDSAWAQWGLFGVLILCGFGLPIPEDIILVTAGFLGAENGKNLLGTCVLMYFGIMIGDGLIFVGGRLFGFRLVNVFVRPEKRDRIQGLFKKYGSGVIFVGRFLPGLRTPIFFTAGTLHFSSWKFFFMDGTAALLSAPVFVWLGHKAQELYADDLHQLEKQLGKTQLYVVGGAIVLALIIFYQLWSRHKKQKKENPTHDESMPRP